MWRIKSSQKENDEIVSFFWLHDFKIKLSRKIEGISEGEITVNVGADRSKVNVTDSKKWFSFLVPWFPDSQLINLNKMYTVDRYKKDY